MVVCRCVGRRGAGNGIYSEGHVALSFGNVTYAHTTLAIAPGDARGRAAGAITPGATDRSIGNRTMVRIMHSNSHVGSPSTVLSGARSIQITDMHGDRC